MLILASKIPPKTKLSSFVSRAEIGKLFLETEGNELKILQLTVQIWIQFNDGIASFRYRYGGNVLIKSPLF